MIRILLVEDEAILLDSLATVLGAQPDFEVVGKLTKAADALEAINALNPDVVLMDVCTEHGSSGIDATRNIMRELPETRIVLMTSVTDLSFVDDARAAGARSFIYKNIKTEDLFSVLRNTVNDYEVYPANARNELLGYNELSERELMILRYLCAGYSRNEIVEELDISLNTVKRDISSALAKTGYDNITKLALFLLSSGYISLPENRIDMPQSGQTVLESKQA